MEDPPPEDEEDEEVEEVEDDATEAPRPHTSALRYRSAKMDATALTTTTMHLADPDRADDAPHREDE